jgi:hypothetical protein
MDPISIISLLGALASLGGGLNSLFNRSGRRNRGGGGMQQGGMQGGLPKGAFQIPKYDPQTMQTLQQLLGMGLQGWQQNQPDFGPIREKAEADFYSNVVPSIAERFAGTSRRSSGLEGALGAAGAGLKRDLSAMEQGFGQQNRNQALQLLQLGLTSPYESVYKGRQPGFGENLAVSALPALIQSAPDLYDMFSKWGTAAPAGGK